MLYQQPLKLGPFYCHNSYYAKHICQVTVFTIMASKNQSPAECLLRVYAFVLYRYAVKTIPKKMFGEYLEPHFVARIRHEVDIYRHMGQSLNVAHLHDVYEDDICVDFVMELCSGGQLWQRIKTGNYSEQQAAR